MLKYRDIDGKKFLKQPDAQKRKARLRFPLWERIREAVDGISFGMDRILIRMDRIQSEMDRISAMLLDFIPVIWTYSPHTAIYSPN